MINSQSSAPLGVGFWGKSNSFWTARIVSYFIVENLVASFGFYFFRRLRPPQAMPSSITTTIRMARAMMPIVSADAGMGMAVGMGVNVGVRVGFKVSSTVGGGRRDGGGGVGVGPGLGISEDDVEVGVLTSAFLARLSKIGAACAGANVRRVATKKVTATRMNNRVMSERGGWVWFIVAQSISRDN